MATHGQRIFTPLLGGTPEAWIDANRVVLDRMLEPESWSKLLQFATDFASFDHTYQHDWLTGMCELVGIRPLPKKDCIVLARHAISFIIPRVHAAFPVLWTPFADSPTRATLSTQPLASPPSSWQATSMEWECVPVLVTSSALI